MQWRNTEDSWGLISKAFHWLMALLILLAIGLGFAAENAPPTPEKVKLFIYHKSIGISLLALLILRLIWRLLSSQPISATGITEKNEHLASLGHWLLYTLMFAVPLSGWILNTAANFPFQWMELFAVPHLPGIPKSWQEPAAQAHWLLFLILAAVVIGHATMAVIHHVKNSNLLMRMLPIPSVSQSSLILVVLLITGAGWIYSLMPRNGALLNELVVNESVASETQSNDSPPIASSSSTTAGHTEKQWQLVADQSHLKFIGTYDGVEFNGEFSRFTADMFFDPEAPEQGYFDVSIDTSSVTTYNDMWDFSLPDAEWFHVSMYPQAQYQTVGMRKEADGYIAEGALSLKGKEQNTPLKFLWQTDDQDRVIFTAEALLSRTDFDVGSGDWAEDPTIGFEVQVIVELVLEPAN